MIEDFCNKCGVVLTNENWEYDMLKRNRHCCRTCKLNYGREWKRNHKEHIAQQRAKKYYSNHEESRKKGREYNKERSRRLKQEIIDAYGGKCVCCGETIFEFLELDHRHGNGNEHRRSLKLGGGVQFYYWVKKEGFPDLFQLLCSNCNQAKYRYDECPHQRKNPTGGPPNA